MPRHDSATLANLPLDLSLETLIQRGLARLKTDRAEGNAVAFQPAMAKAFARIMDEPNARDAAVIRAARQLPLDAGDLFHLFLLWRAEVDPALAVQIGAMQQGDDRFRPGIGLLADLAALITPTDVASVQRVLEGPLFRWGMARLLPCTAPMALAPVALTDAALAGFGLPGAMALRADAPPDAETVPVAYHRAVDRLVQQDITRKTAIILRGGLPAEQRLFGQVLAAALGRALLHLDQPGAAMGIGAALALQNAVPLEIPRGTAGERFAVAPIAPYVGLRLFCLGEDGGIDAPDWNVMDVRLPALSAEEARHCWRQAGGTAAEQLPLQGLGPLRLSAIAARIALAPDKADLGAAQVFRAAAGAEARPDLEPHGRLVTATVGDAALVAAPGLLAELRLLLARCHQRRDTRSALGPAYHARGAGNGVRALLAGPSGSGKTLACSWLASHLHQPLFRVDLASVMSKYIGETEENLARILDRAESADVILLFDEADSLLGARTEVKDSSDKFANNQTNYLLTRIEAYNGIVLMTTNGRSRIDAAFSRRIDQIIDVPIPDARERRAIWRAHLGQGHALDQAELNRLATAADIAGGHIRAVVETAAVMACAEARCIEMADIRAALLLEYRKIGRSAPSDLVRA